MSPEPKNILKESPLCLGPKPYSSLEDGPQITPPVTGRGSLPQKYLPTANISRHDSYPIKPYGRKQKQDTRYTCSPWETQIPTRLQSSASLMNTKNNQIRISDNKQLVKHSLAWVILCKRHRKRGGDSSCRYFAFPVRPIDSAHQGPCPRGFPGKSTPTLLYRRSQLCLTLAYPRTVTSSLGFFL